MATYSTGLPNPWAPTAAGWTGANQFYPEDTRAVAVTNPTSTYRPSLNFGAGQGYAPSIPQGGSTMPYGNDPWQQYMGQYTQPTQNFAGITAGSQPGGQSPYQMQPSQFGGIQAGMAGGTPAASGAGGALPAMGLGGNQAGLGNPQQAVLQSMRELGVNPFGSGVLVKQAMDNATKLVQSLIPQISQMGGMAADPGAQMNLIREQVQRALSGGNTFYAPSQMASMLPGLQNYANQNAGAPGQGNLGANMLRDIFNSPESTVSLMNTLGFSGLGNSARYFTQGMDMLAPAIQDYLGTAQYRPGVQNQSALDILQGADFANLYRR